MTVAWRERPDLRNRPPVRGAGEPTRCGRAAGSAVDHEEGRFMRANRTKGTGERMKPRRSRLAGVLIAVAATALLVVALIPSGASANHVNGALVAPEANAPVPTSVGKGEGKLNLIAWEGYVQPEWTKPFEQQTGCQVNVKYGRILQRHGVADGQRWRPPVRPGLRLRRRRPAPDLRRRRAAGQPRADPGVEGLPAVPAEPVVQHDRRQALRRLVRVRTRTCCSTRRRSSRPRRPRGRCSTTRSTPVR